MVRNIEVAKGLIDSEALYFVPFTDQFAPQKGTHNDEPLTLRSSSIVGLFSWHLESSYV